MAKINFYPKKIMVIGNGFDLNQKFPTSYGNFLNSNEFKGLNWNGYNALCKYLLNQQKIKNWIDLENELKTYSASINLGIETDDLKKDFKSLSSKLIEYLKSIDCSKIAKETPSYNALKSIIDDDFIVVDFNYTHTIKFILSSLNISQTEIDKRLIKIHGSIENNEIVFGVEDSANINSEHVFLKKAYSKNIPMISFNNQLENATEIHFFGHSLGETDHTYFNAFFNKYSSSKFIDHGKKIYFYYCGEDGWDKLHIQLDKLTQQNLTLLKQVNEFIAIDVSKII